MQYLRCNIMPGLFKALSFNSKRNYEFLRLFEIGSISNYCSKNYNEANEERMLGLAYLGNTINTWRENIN